jgi:hypothetical protein
MADEDIFSALLWLRKTQGHPIAIDVSHQDAWIMGDTKQKRTVPPDP